MKEAADAARAEFGVYERKDVQLREVQSCCVSPPLLAALSGSLPAEDAVLPCAVVLQNLKHTKSKGKKLDKTIASDTKSIGDNESTVQRLQEDAVRFAEEIEKKQAELVTAEEMLKGIQEECKVRFAPDIWCIAS